MDEGGVGESKVTRALRFVVERLAADPGARRAVLIDEAARRFDLSPIETDLLVRHLIGPLPGQSAGSPP